MMRINRGVFLIVLGIALCGGLGCKPRTPPVAQTPPPVVTVSQPIEKEIIDYDFYTGRTEASKTVEVRARVRGELFKVLFEDGAFVKAGDPLFEIDPRPYKAELDAAVAQKAAAEAKRQEADVEYKRTEDLVRRKAAAEADLLAWAAKRGVFEAEAKKADAAIEQAKLNLGFTSIKAPITGRISRSLVNEGNLVNSGGGDTLLTTIVAIDPMYVYFDVNEPALLRYQRQAQADAKGKRESVKEANIPVAMGLALDEDRFPFEGTLDFAESKVDPETGTLRVRGVFPNKDRRLTPGLFAKVRVPVSDPYKALLVTDRAIGTDQGQKYLLVVNDENKAEYRVVAPGRLDGDLRIFRPGRNLKPGEWVVVNGLQRVRPGIEVKPEREPMPTKAVDDEGQPGGE
jgi:RND family efflux transporter MFP subunit